MVKFNIQRKLLSAYVYMTLFYLQSWEHLKASLFLLGHLTSHVQIKTVKPHLHRTLETLCHSRACARPPNLLHVCRISPAGHMQHQQTAHKETVLKLSSIILKLY